MSLFYTSKHGPGNPSAMTWCPSVTTLIGSTPGGSTDTLLPIRCRRWTCPFCRMCNEILTKEKVLSGKPSKMLTLTIRPNPKETPRETYVRSRSSISRLYQTLRRHAGEWEAATFLERHGSGFPHWHALVRGNWVPIELVRSTWRDLTGSFIVDLRRIKDPRVATRYVSKYVTKQLSNLIKNRLGRILTFTRSYLPEKESLEKRTGMRWTWVKRHPEAVAASYGTDCKISWEGRVGTVQLQPLDYGFLPREADAAALKIVFGDGESSLQQDVNGAGAV